MCWALGSEGTHPAPGVLVDTAWARGGRKGRVPPPVPQGHQHAAPARAPRSLTLLSGLLNGICSQSMASIMACMDTKMFW